MEDMNLDRADEPVLKVVDLSHRYQVQWAVKDISFELHKHGIYGLLGANGAGKSTIMNVVCGVLSQSHGEVYIQGINVKKNPIEAKKHIGFLPQKPPLLMDMTVEEYLVHAARVRLMAESSITEALKRVLERCGLTHYRSRLLRNLSGGYQQRVGIAQAIIHDPSLVVFDEPTNGLDPNQILEVRRLIKEIARERTVILSTHILQEVQALCDTIWMIHEGSMVFSGSLDDFDGYLAPNTLKASFLGMPSPEDLILVPGIFSARHTDRANYVLEFDHATETLERLIETSVEKGWRLIELSMDKKSLDSVFAVLSKHKSNQ